MLNAIAYLHENNIWNRDIKLESFFVFNPPDSKDANNPLILLCNFEYAKVFEEGQKSTEYIGTPEFMAPEIANKVPYNNSIDIWSLGITLFMMLTNQSPYPDFKTSPQECLKHVSRGEINYQILVNKNISNDAIEFIRKMCQIDPKQRITAIEATNDPWVLQSNIDPNLAANVNLSEVEDYSSQAF